MIATPPNATAARLDGLYVYCVARGDGQRLPASLGIDGQPVHTVASGQLLAVVHPCPPQPYQSKDPTVVKQWVVAHQNVVQAAADAFGTVLPMSFDMIVRGEGPAGAAKALAGWLTERHDRFLKLLQRLDGKAEYEIQVFWDRQVIAASLARSDKELRGMQDELRAKPRGMAHVLQQKLTQAVRVAMESQADAFAQDFYARIRRCVDDIHVDKLRKSDGGRQMLLNLSCLMRQGSGELGCVLDEIEKTNGIVVRFTGPWPPYSFVGG